MSKADIVGEGNNFTTSGSTKSINDSLTKLRDELNSMRNQDIQLLKQLIKISDTIQTISNSWDSPHHMSRIKSCQILSPTGYNNNKNCISGIGFPITSHYARRQSAPSLNLEENIRNVEFNIEETSVSSEDLSEESEVDEEEIVQGIGDVISMPPVTASCIEPPLVLTIGQEKDYTDDTYEEILKTNVRLWKHVQMSERVSPLPSTTSEIDISTISKYRNNSQDNNPNISNSEGPFVKQPRQCKSRSLNSRKPLSSWTLSVDTNDGMKESKSSSNLEIIRECEDQGCGMRHFQTFSDLHSELEQIT